MDRSHTLLLKSEEQLAGKFVAKLGINSPIKAEVKIDSESNEFKCTGFTKLNKYVSLTATVDNEQEHSLKGNLHGYSRYSNS
jgi:hypothetical protein